jgi:hypothetical protein
LSLTSFYFVLFYIVHYEPDHEEQGDQEPEGRNVAGNVRVERRIVELAQYGGAEGCDDEQDDEPVEEIAEIRSVSPQLGQQAHAYLGFDETGSSSSSRRCNV